MSWSVPLWDARKGDKTKRQTPWACPLLFFVLMTMKGRFYPGEHSAGTWLELYTPSGPREPLHHHGALVPSCCPFFFFLIFSLFKN